MKGRLANKISEIKQYLRELNTLLPQDLEEYESNFEKRAACERYLEKIVEATVDLAFLYVKKEGLAMPEDDSQAFDVLANAGIISEELAKKLKNAKGMRNVIAHRYGSVDDEMVFHTITEELEKDVTAFIKIMRGKAKH